MAVYAIYRDGVFVEERNYETKPFLPNKPQLKFYTVEKVNPSYDAATQVKEGPTVEEDHTNEIRRYVWTVRSKTSGELDTEKELSIDRLDLVTMRVLFNHENRIRVLEGRPQVTAQQFRDAIKGLL